MKKLACIKKLSAYEIACGGIEKYIFSECHLFKTYAELYKEHNIYHVRCFKSTKGCSVLDRIMWEDCSTLTESRRLVSKLFKHMKLKKEI